MAYLLESAQTALADVPQNFEILLDMFCSQPTFQTSCAVIWSAKLWLVTFLQLSVFSPRAPFGFPTSGNGLWYATPGTLWTKHFLPVGNGHLGAMVPGGTNYEITQLNIESMWSGGPFANRSYNGGNKHPSERNTTAHVMKDIQQRIFQSPNGEIDHVMDLATAPGAFGSYAGAGYFLTSLDAHGKVYRFARWLDLDEGVARTTWTQGGIPFLRETFCSSPVQACIQYTTAKSRRSTLPSVKYAYSTLNEAGLPVPEVDCLDSSTLRVRGMVGAPGMIFEIVGRVQGVGPKVKIICKAVNNPGTRRNATVTVKGAKEAWISWFAETEFSQEAGNEGNNFSFKGPDPHLTLMGLVSTLERFFEGKKDAYAELLTNHVKDFKNLFSSFELSLGQVPDVLQPTDALVTKYETDLGNPYLEWLLFNFGRYLLGSSARGELPSNLQGIWGDGYLNPWGADYHANINIQMNYWSAEMTNLDVTQGLFDYLEKNWVPRGTQTAQTLYNSSRGWVTHNEMNIFGHTGMKLSGNSAQYANYPESAAWMMMHVWDHFDHTNDVYWWRTQGWPLLKGVASFNLDRLIPDRYHNDSTLVVNPCNSPEQKPITFACAHSQQLIWQLFSYVERGFEASGDHDLDFLNEVRAKKGLLDNGIRIGSWGQLQEWKIEKDSPYDTHRHLSHLIGLYPGFAITSYEQSKNTSYSKSEVMEAARVSLVHRGVGVGPDADAGWEKVWRAACWAQLGDPGQFYHILTYLTKRNFGPNLFSLYEPSKPDSIFQIDGNLGYPSTVMNALLQAPDTPTQETPLVITLLPALPRAWASGHVSGARVRGGMTVNLNWTAGKASSFEIVVDSTIRPRPVEVRYNGETVLSFRTSGGLRKTIGF